MIFYSLGCQSQEMREGGIVSRGATIEPKVTFGSQSHHRTRQEFNRPSIESGCRKISVHRNKLPQRQGCAITQPDGLGYVNCWAFGPKSSLTNSPARRNSTCAESMLAQAGTEASCTASHRLEDRDQDCQEAIDYFDLQGCWSCESHNLPA